LSILPVMTKLTDQEERTYNWIPLLL
jgi:hypothetical protein